MGSIKSSFFFHHLHMPSNRIVYIVERNYVGGPSEYKFAERGGCGLHQTLHDALHQRSHEGAPVRTVVLRVPQPPPPKRVVLYLWRFHSSQCYSVLFGTIRNTTKQRLSYDFI